MVVWLCRQDSSRPSKSMSSRHAVLLTPPIPLRFRRNSHGIISFADPHHLNSVVSYRYKDTGRGAFLGFQRSNIQPSNRSYRGFWERRSRPGRDVPTYSDSKSFICNTYAAPRKCCKQKTYGSTKSQLSPVDATLTKNWGAPTDSPRVANPLPQVPR